MTETHNTHILTHPPPPHSDSLIFSVAEFFKTNSGIPYEVVRHCETKTVRHKIIKSWYSLIMQKFFGYTNSFETPRVSPRNILGTETEKINEEDDMDPLFYRLTFSKPEFFSNTEGFTHGLFQYNETTSF